MSDEASNYGSLSRDNSRNSQDEVSPYIGTTLSSPSSSTQVAAAFQSASASSFPLSQYSTELPQDQSSSQSPNLAKASHELIMEQGSKNLSDIDSLPSVSNVSAETEKMKVFATANVTSGTRHARRIYVGGIPPNYADEEALRNFLNDVIAKGLNEENDHSYVLSVYMNHKKCYAFVELKSVELTSACMELDGIIFKKIVLKILRANEYRPDLVTESQKIRLDLSGFSFGTPAILSNSSSLDDSEGHLSRGTSQREILLPAADCLASLIQFTNVTGMQLGSISIVGFPYGHDGAAAGTRRGNTRGMGQASAPRALRTSMSLFHHGAVQNSEYGIDLSTVKFMDVGDVLAGKTIDETKAFLSTTVTELISRGSVPFVVGGTKDQSFHTALGLIGAAGGGVGVMSISAQLDHRLLLHDGFCPPVGGTNTCDGRYICFGAQGSQCAYEASRLTTDRGGKIIWLTKDLRTPTTSSVAVPQYLKHLRGLSRSVKNCSSKTSLGRDDASSIHGSGGSAFTHTSSASGNHNASMMVTLDASVLCNVHSPLCSGSSSSIGLTLEEVLEIAFISGAHPNVVLFEITGFNPEVEESRANLILADILYKFSLGVATRPIYGGQSNRTPHVPVAHGNALGKQNFIPSTPESGAGYTGSGSTDSLFTPSLYNQSANVSHETLDWERHNEIDRSLSSSASGYGNNVGINTNTPSTPPIRQNPGLRGSTVVQHTPNVYPSPMRTSPHSEFHRSPGTGSVGAPGQSTSFRNQPGAHQPGTAEDISADGVGFRHKQQGQQILPRQNQQQQIMRQVNPAHYAHQQQHGGLPHQSLPQSGYAMSSNTRHVGNNSLVGNPPSSQSRDVHAQPPQAHSYYHQQQQNFQQQHSLQQQYQQHVRGQQSTSPHAYQRDANHFAMHGMAPMASSSAAGGEVDNVQGIAPLHSSSNHVIFEGNYQQNAHQSSNLDRQSGIVGKSSAFNSSSSTSGYTTGASSSTSLSGRYAPNNGPGLIGSQSKGVGYDNGASSGVNFGGSSFAGQNFDFGGILPQNLHQKQSNISMSDGGQAFETDELGIKHLGHVPYFDD